MQAQEKHEAVRVELKYCESCGGLWLRAAGDEVAYCGRCVALLATCRRVGGAGAD